MAQSLIAQINEEYELWYTYVQAKRTKYRNRIKKRDWQTKKDSKININMIADALDVLIASSYSDRLTVKFAPRNWVLWQRQADSLNYLAEFDQTEEDYQQQYYQKEQDRYFFGVAIRVRQWRDDTKKTSTFWVINPLSWIPDPLPTQTWKFNGQNYRFHGFSTHTSIFDLIKSDKNNKSVLNKIISSRMGEESRQTQDAYNDMWGYLYVTCDNLAHNFSVEIYNHYTIHNWRKYLVVTDSTRTHIIKQEELPAILKEEKEDPSLIRFPIILNYWAPRRGDPFGESVTDRLESKQDAKEMLFNLNLAKAKKEALGWDFLVNSRLINRKDLLKPATRDRYISFDDKGWTASMWNAMMELPRSQIKTDSYNMISSIEREAINDSWIDQLQAGIMPDKTMTKAEAQQIQQNANIKSILKNSVNWRGDKDFWFERWKWYQQYFSQTDKKFILLRQSFEYTSLKITKDDVFTKQMPHIIVWLKSDLEAVDEQQKLYMNAQLPLILQDPAVPEVSKMFARRNTYRLNWKTPSEINVLAPMTADERKAIAFSEMVNQNIIPESLFANPNLDLFTVYIYMQNADETSAKDKVIQVLQEALAGKQAGTQGEQFNQIANASASQMTAKATQWQGWEVLSRASTLPS